jgi:hypothetical protein
MTNPVKYSDKIEFITKWTPQFKAKETPQKCQDRHEKHQAMLQDHKERKALAQEKHKAGWHKFKFAPNTLF